MRWEQDVLYIYIYTHTYGEPSLDPMILFALILGTPPKKSIPNFGKLPRRSADAVDQGLEIRPNLPDLKVCGLRIFFHRFRSLWTIVLPTSEVQLRA